jgi:hypothetical protein
MVCENVSLIPSILIPYKYSRVPVNKLLIHHQRDPLLLVLFQEGAPFLLRRCILGLTPLWRCDEHRIQHLGQQDGFH